MTGGYLLLLTLTYVPPRVRAAACEAKEKARCDASFRVLLEKDGPKCKITRRGRPLVERTLWESPPCVGFFRAIKNPRLAGCFLMFLGWVV